MEVRDVAEVAEDAAGGTETAMSTGDARKTAEHYLALRYAIELRELAPEEGGGWMATIPQLGSQTFVGDGDTPEAAVAALDALRRDLIPRLVENGTALPEPKAEEPVEQSSGRLMLRIPRGLHAALARAARESDCSINKLATQLLAQGVERQAALAASTAVSDLMEKLRRSVEMIAEEEGGPGRGAGGGARRGRGAAPAPARRKG